MAEYIYLNGSEDVRQASINMLNAAQTMKDVHNWSSEHLDGHRLFMDDWLNRFEQVLKDHSDRELAANYGSREIGPR